MKRYTKRYADGTVVLGLVEYNGYLGEAIRKLADYEDSGLSPKEVIDLKNKYCKGD